MPHIWLSQRRTKFGHFRRVSHDQNLVVFSLVNPGQIFLSQPEPKFGHIQPSQPRPKFCWVFPDPNFLVFGHVVLDKNLTEFYRVSLNQNLYIFAESISTEIHSNLVESTLTKIRSNLTKSTTKKILLVLTKIQTSQPRPKVNRVRLMLKFDHVGLDQNYAKFDRVDPKDASFRKFILNFFYKKIDYGFWTWSKCFDLDLNRDPNVSIWI